MKAVASNLKPWAFGTLLAFAGVAVARLAPPAFSGARAQLLATTAGRLLAVAGLVVIMLGIRRRIRFSTPPETASAGDRTS